MYVPLEIIDHNVYGGWWASKAVRLPKKQAREHTREEDIALLSKLVKAGDDHAKAVRGILLYVQIECQVGWLLEYLTYRIGVEGLGSSSSMHGELKHLTGEALAVQKQDDLDQKVYTRIEMISYQALRHMYKARRNHRHPDWGIFCDFIETLPYADELITV